MLYLDPDGDVQIAKPRRFEKLRHKMKCAYNQFVVKPRMVLWDYSKAVGRGVMRINNSKPVQNAADVCETTAKFVAPGFFIYKTFFGG